MGAESPSVACIVLNLNGGDVLREALHSIKAMKYPRFSIIVVDNGSHDGSQDMVRSLFAGSTLIENESNLGFGEGNNVGIRHALDSTGQAFDWVLLLNNDVVAAPDMLSELMKVAVADSTIGIAAPKIYYHSRPDILWYAGGNVNYWTGIVSHRGVGERDTGRYDRVEDTEYISGCAMLIRRPVLENVGLFDPVYSPAYSEDADLSTRTSRAGYRLVYVPQAKLWHKVSSYSGGGTSALKTRLKVEHNLIYMKRYARWYHWLTIPWCVGGLALVFVAKQIATGNFAIVGALAQGFVSAIGSLFSSRKVSRS